MDAISKKVVEDTLIDVKFVDCLGGNEGFYYSSYEKQRGELSAKTDEHKLYFHKLGTAQKRIR
jgi:prolyl oligopeptidase